MVTLTDNAIGLIRRLADRRDAPDQAGVRIASGSGAGSLTVRVTDRPYNGDQVVDTCGARLFLDAEAARVLDDKALDAALIDGSVTFSVAEPPSPA